MAMMHGQIKGVSPDKRQPDHENGVTLDNRRNNLRFATSSQNAMNRRKTSANSSGYKGVHWHKGHQKWCAQIKVNGKSIHLGYFDTPEEAHAAYCEAATRLHGDFARLA